MKRTLIALTAAGALAAGTISVPQQAEAHAWWLIPAAIVGGVVVGGAIAHSSRAYAGGPYGYDYGYGYRSGYGAYPTYAGARGAVYVNPSNCRIVRERVRGGWRRVEVCR